MGNDVNSSAAVAVRADYRAPDPAPSDKSSSNRVTPGYFSADADAKAVTAAYYALNAPGDRAPEQMQFLRENVDIAEDTQHFHQGDQAAGIRGNALIAKHLIGKSAEQDVANRDPEKADGLRQAADGNASRGLKMASDLLDLGQTYYATPQGRTDIISAHALALQAGEEHARLAGEAIVEGLDDFAAASKNGDPDNDVRRNLFDAANEAPRVASELDDSVARLSRDSKVIGSDEGLAKAANLATDHAVSLRAAAAAAAPLAYEAFDSANRNFEQKSSEFVAFKTEKQHGMNGADQKKIGQLGDDACSAARQMQGDAKNVIDNPASMPADIEIAKVATLKATSFLRHYTGDDQKHV